MQSITSRDIISTKYTIIDGKSVILILLVKLPLVRLPLERTTWLVDKSAPTNSVEISEEPNQGTAECDFTIVGDTMETLRAFGHQILTDSFNEILWR
ncbi:MAG: hypothetical protein WC819_03535 [Parcubacteria group bacterium]|jgi:hypothetical protein